MMSAHRSSSPVGRQCHSNWPLAASSATTSRLMPAVVYMTPSTIRGLTCIVVAGRGPKFRADQRQATRRLRTLAAVIWFAYEYRVAPASPPKNRHSMSFLDALASLCPARVADSPIADPRAMTAKSTLTLHGNIPGSLSKAVLLQRAQPL